MRRGLRSQDNSGRGGVGPNPPPILPQRGAGHHPTPAPNPGHSPPLVAAGIVDHSDHATDPLRRLVRTMGALYPVVFGTRAEADAVAARVRAVHAHVRGERDGVPYAASDPELALWVHATLVDTGI